MGTTVFSFALSLIFCYNNIHILYVCYLSYQKDLQCIGDKTMDIKDYLAQWCKLDYILPEDIPDIELYMDQVTTFMDRHFSNSKRFKEDKTLTKTMINNYTKNKLMPPPIKKKYSKNQIYLLIYIYYFKNILSISDIQKLLNPLTERFYKATPRSKTVDFTKIYTELYHLEHEHHYKIVEQIEETIELAKSAFPELEGEDREFLQHFATIALLSYDIFLRKQIIEKIIDNFYTP